MKKQRSLSRNSCLTKKQKTGIILGSIFGGLALIGTGIGIGYAIWHKKTPKTSPYNDDGSNWQNHTAGTVNMSYYDNGGTKLATIDSINNYSAKNLVIPDTIVHNNEEYKVYRISTDAFKNDTSLTGTITFGQYLYCIDHGAFQGCTNLSGKLYIPDSVVIVGDNCFTNTNLEWSIANSVQYSWTDESEYHNIWCFGGQSAITGALTLNANTYGIVGSAFVSNSGISNSWSQIIGGLNKLRSICSSAFMECSSITDDLVLPNTVNYVGQKAFYDCNSAAFQTDQGVYYCKTNSACTNIWALSVNYSQGTTASFSFIPGTYGVAAYTFSVGSNAQKITGSLTIPSTIVAINNDAFSSQTLINNINLADWNVLPKWSGINCFRGVNTIGTVSHTNCSFSDSQALIYLKSVGLPSGWTSAN